MKKAILVVLVVVNLIFASNGYAFFTAERNDNLLDANDNAVFMIGSAYNLLTSAKIDPKEDSFRIYKIDLKDNIKSLFYEGERRFLNRLTMSPDNKYIAVIRSEKYRYVDIFLIDKKLKIGSQTISEPDGIITYAWSPDSKKIAYMAGTLGERGKINSKGIFVYNLEKKEKKRVAESAMDIEWLPTGELCLYNEYIEPKDGYKVSFYKTVVVNDETGAIQAEKEGINLSQDGRYSIDPRYIGWSEIITDKILIDFIDLKERKTILGSTLNNIFVKRARILWEPILWLKGNRMVIEREVQNSLDWDISICDFVNNRELKVVRGRIIGVNSDRSKLVIYSDGKFTAVDVP